MDKKFSFKVFNSSSEFEDWQRNEDVQICSICPIVIGLGMKMSTMDADASSQIGAFVVYCTK